MNDMTEGTNNDESTIPSRENVFSRIHYDSERNRMFCDFSRLQLTSSDHVENVRFCLKDVLDSQSAKDVDAIVNYDGFHLTNDELVELYSETVARYFTDNYYKSIRRYTTKGSTSSGLSRTNSIDKLDALLTTKRVRSGSIYRDQLEIGHKYLLDHLIGEGSFGRVYYAHDVKSGDHYAIKQVDMNRVAVVGIEEFMEREHKIMRQLSLASDAHRNIVKMHDLIQKGHFLYIVLEYCSGGSLELEGNEPFPEELAHCYFVQIIDALNYMHERHCVMHRDLQLQNICLADNNVVKLSDFGFSDWFTPNEATHSLFCGNISYMPPELILKKSYIGPEVDTWGAGVCLYKMVIGILPFRSSANTLAGKLSIPLNEEDSISEECKDLIKKILNPDISRRYNIHQIMQHPWFTKFNHDTLNVSSEEVISD